MKLFNENGRGAKEARMSSLRCVVLFGRIQVPLDDKMNQGCIPLVESFNDSVMLNKCLFAGNFYENLRELVLVV